jgi:hypothetical protein
MKIKLKNGGFARLMHAVFDSGTQLTHWDMRKDNTLAAFKRSGPGQKLHHEAKAGRAWGVGRFTVKSQFFTTPPRELATA